jgi:hypothetical protein
MPRVISFDMVDMIIPDGTELPIEVRQYLALYDGKRMQHTQSGEKATRYTIPRYMMVEWLGRYDPAALAAVESRKGL